MVAVVGDIDAETLGPLLDRTFGGLAASGPEPDKTPAAAERPAGLKVIKQDIPQTVILFGGAGLLRSDPDFIPAYVMNYILGGGGFASRLMKQVREKRGLAYNVSTSLVPNDLAGILVGYVATENSRAAQSLNLIKAEFTRMRDGGATEAELADAKTYLTGAYPLRFDSNDDIADELLGIQMENLGIDYIDKRNGLIRAVTADDIKRVAQRILHPDHLMVVAVGQPGDLSGKTPPPPASAAPKPDTKTPDAEKAPAVSKPAPRACLPPPAWGPCSRCSACGAVISHLSPGLPLE